MQRIITSKSGPFLGSALRAKAAGKCKSLLNITVGRVIQQELYHRGPGL